MSNQLKSHKRYSVLKKICRHDNGIIAHLCWIWCHAVEHTMFWKGSVGLPCLTLAPESLCSFCSETWGEANLNSVNFEQQTKRACYYGGLVTQIHAETSCSLTAIFFQTLWSKTTEQPRIVPLTVKLSSHPELKHDWGWVQRYTWFNGCFVNLCLGGAGCFSFQKTKQTILISFLEAGQRFWKKNYRLQPEAKLQFTEVGEQEEPEISVVLSVTICCRIWCDLCCHTSLCSDIVWSIASTWLCTWQGLVQDLRNVTLQYSSAWRPIPSHSNTDAGLRVYEIIWERYIDVKSCILTQFI